MSGFKAGIKISLSAKKPESPAASLSATVKSKAPTVAAVFNDSDESEPEEMPAEARIRMRNIGKHTPTSAGPNSYGKTNRGFTDRRAEIEKQLRQQLEKASDDADQPFSKRKASPNREVSADGRRNVPVDQQKSSEEPQQPPSKRPRSFGDDHEDAGGVKILPLKNSFTDIVQDVGADEDDASDS